MTAADWTTGGVVSIGPVPWVAWSSAAVTRRRCWLSGRTHRGEPAKLDACAVPVGLRACDETREGDARDGHPVREPRVDGHLHLIRQRRHLVGLEEPREQRRVVVDAILRPCANVERHRRHGGEVRRHVGELQEDVARLTAARSRSVVLDERATVVRRRDTVVDRCEQIRGRPGARCHARPSAVPGGDQVERRTSRGGVRDRPIRQVPRVVSGDVLDRTGRRRRVAETDDLARDHRRQVRRITALVETVTVVTVRAAPPTVTAKAVVFGTELTSSTSL